MPDRLRLFFNYRTVAGPWGGANSFLRSLQQAFAADQELEIVPHEHAPCDVFFLNQLYRGPGRPRWSRKFLSVSQLRRLRRSGTTNFWQAWCQRLTGRPAAQPPAIVCRLVNHSEHAYGKANLEQVELFRALAHTTADIFQTKYLHEVFQASGYSKPGYTIIHNGVDQTVFHNHDRIAWHPGKPLVVVSSAMTRRQTKRFDLIAAMSEQPQVESYHLGIWPEGVPTKKVRLLGQKGHVEIAEFFRKKAHAFMHPAEKDICPNTVIEAMSCGLPVFYSRLGGTAELVGQNGVALDEGIGPAVARLKESYSQLCAGLQERHAYFSIQRALREYKAVFQSTAAAARPNRLSP